MQHSESPHTHTHAHTNLIVCVDTSDTVGNDSARFLLYTLFYFSNIHDVTGAERHRVFFFVSLSLYKSGQWKYELTRRMKNVGHINRSEGLTSSYKYDGWVGGEFKDITHKHTHTLSTRSPLRCVVAPLKRTVQDLVVTNHVFFFFIMFWQSFSLFLFMLSGAQRKVGEKAKRLKGSTEEKECIINLTLTPAIKAM